MLDTKQVVIVGRGSAGRRHLAVLTRLGCRCAVVSRTDTGDGASFRSLDQALASFNPGYVVIANETAAHHRALRVLSAAGYAGVCMVEKPLFKEWEEGADVEVTFPIFVGYNLRFHPMVRRFRADAGANPVIALRAHVGQYLPDWRPGTPLAQSYSISHERGGGVLRDLSHELDFLTWVLGPWQRVTALGGKLSALPGDVEDCVGVLMETKNCRLVEVHLDYLDRRPRREILAHYPAGSVRYDLLTNAVDGDTPDLQASGADGMTTTTRMHEAVLSGISEDVCGFREGLAVNGLIGAIERSLQTGSWVAA